METSSHPTDSTTPCNRDERKALKELAAPLADAIITTEAREKRDSRLKGLLRNQERRLSAIEARLWEAK